MRRINFRWTTAWTLLCLTALSHAQAQKATASQKPSPQPNLNSQLLSRSGTIVLKVPDYDAARQQVLETAQIQGAELMDAKTKVDPKGRKSGWMHLRVSAPRLPALLPAVGRVGRLYADNVQSTDNTSEYEELARRVTRLQQHEGRLNGVLQSDRRMRGSDVLFLQERLFRASVDESLLSQQRLDLERSAITSTVTIELFEPGTMPNVDTNQPVNLSQRFAGAAGYAKAGLNHQMARAATAGAYALVYAPFWAPALLVVLVFLRWLWVRRRAIIAWLISALTRVLTRVVALLATAIGWVRMVWDARHTRLGFRSVTDEERFMQTETAK
jgi:hypothetical protein